MTQPALTGRDRFRARVLPLVLMAVIAGCFAYFALRMVRGLPSDADPYKGDFEHFYHAAAAMAGGQDIYASHTRGYIYPPLVAMLLIPLGMIEDTWTAQAIYGAINLLLVAVTLAMGWRAVRTRLGLPADRLTALAVTAVGLVFCFEPVRQEIEEGQTDTLVAVSLAASLLALDRRPWLAGLLIGFAGNVKYQSLVVLPYLLLRRRWAAAAGSVAGLAFFALVPAVVVGWRTNMEYLAVAFRGVGKLFGLSASGAAVATHDIRWEKSVSITSGFAKTLGPDVSDTLVIGLAGVAALSVLACAWLIYRLRGTAMLAGRGGDADLAGPRRGVVLIEWAGLAVAVLAFSPQTTVRHMYIALPVFMIAAALLLVPRVGVARWPLAVGVAVAIAGMLLPPGNVESVKPMLDQWRQIGGSSWCLVLMFLTLLLVGLETERARAAGAPLADPPPGYDAQGRRVGAAG